jgi:hypothetical protein
MDEEKNEDVSKETQNYKLVKTKIVDGEKSIHTEEETKEKIVTEKTKDNVDEKFFEKKVIVEKSIQSKGRGE